MRRLTKVLLACGAVGTAALAPSTARAITEPEPPMPNVLLLVDTSGSMEYLLQAAADGTNQLPGAVPGSECIPGTTPTLMNRWATLVTVMTGQINNFSCNPSPRDAVFETEYKFNGVTPYDFKYYLPFHRLLSNKCTPGPGTSPVNWYDWPATGINFHDISGTAVACAGGGWSQATDGVLDVFRDRVRFALMTFDSFPNAGTGTTGNAPNATTGMAGQWSYYNGWQAGAGFATGRPGDCLTAPSPYEVGARGPAAPPWEGRMVPFGADDAALAAVRTTNDRIQTTLLSMRPFGATPIAGMLDDAKQFLLNDTATDPATTKPFGPKNDAYYTGGCRKQFIILLSDGEPNQDLRPECATGVGGVCPYAPATTTADYLAKLAGANKNIITYVIGIGVSNPTALAPLGLTSCSELDPALQCTNPVAGLRACCELAKIAAAGGTQKALFADDPVSLKAQLAKVLSGISSGSSARTTPVFSGASASGGAPNAKAVGYRFVGQFTADPTGVLWSGDLKRQRFECKDSDGDGVTTAELQPVTASSGDDFAENVNSDTAARPRQFFSFVAPKVGGVISSSRTIRPSITADDGLGTYAMGTAATAMTPADGPTFATTLKASPEALGLGVVAPLACTTSLGASLPDTCVEKLVRWHVGETNAGIALTRDKSSCPSGSTCSELGSIYHSTPTTIGPPREGIRDSAYTTFSVNNNGRPVMLYTATTDGQLHAFEVAASNALDVFQADTLANNELWSFFPPTVLPSLLTSYNQQAILLDGAPVVTDVVFERKRTGTPVWKTVLLAGGGPAGGFYYALDVTDPKTPKFLWQLSTDSSGAALFGKSTPTPVVATVTLADNGTEVKEVAVAILAGGSADGASGTCNRGTSSSLMSPASIPPRTQVRCWAASAARSLTIVRLDTGEVLMNFRATAAEGPAGLVGKSKTKVVEFSSPITGVPVAFPWQTGQVADRVYVGDADGNLWRVNLSGANPANWSVALAWDAYPTSATGTGIPAGYPAGTPLIGEPIQTAPVISTNAVGDVVVLFATGDQEVLSRNDTMDTRIWSLTESRDAQAGKFVVTKNWTKAFPLGERVTGPMALFDSVAYYSTFAPVGLGVCSYGSSKVYATEYVTGANRFPNPAAPGTYKEYEIAQNTIVFGVGVTKVPNCQESASVTDPYFGASSYVSNVNKGAYQISWNAGAGTGVTGNGSVTAKDAVTGLQTMNVREPQPITKLNAWASILD